MEDFLVIVTSLNFLVLMGISGYIFVMHKYFNKHDIVSYVSAIFQVSERNIKKDLHSFLLKLKQEYEKQQQEIINLLKEQEKQVEILRVALLTEANVFKEYCEERVKVQRELIETTEKRLKDAQKQIAKLENMLSKCRKKIERLKNENKTS